jgi:ubiquinone/menaquinone biosynthesis C-methylase UbiE
MTQSFKVYDVAVGIDINSEHIESSRRNSHNNHRFEVMDAEKIEFTDGYFDTVAIRHSLHHLKNVDVVLAEMKRVLKPGGLFIICEVFQEPETERPNSQRHLHHWWAEVDRALGNPHNDTFTKKEILRAVDLLQMEIVEIFEYMEEFDESDGQEILKSFLKASNDYLEKPNLAEKSPELILKGKVLIDRFEKSGFINEKSVYIIARK